MFKLLALTLLLAASAVTAKQDVHDQRFLRRNGYGDDNFYRACRGNGNGNNKEMELEVTLYNVAYRQPFSPFFIAVHNEYAPDLFSLGMPATDGLAEIAETGATNLLQTMFESDSNVQTVKVEQGPEIPLLRAGEKTVFTVTVSCDYPYVSLASMAVNTNDCFVGINHMMLMPDMVVTVPGYDSGSEVNNEDCDYIPGPACAEMGESNLRTEGEGEGVVSVHRGVHGMWQGNMTHLDPSLHDWRNPMLKISVKESC